MNFLYIFFFRKMLFVRRGYIVLKYFKEEEEMFDNVMVMNRWFDRENCFSEYDIDVEIILKVFGF